MKNIDAVIDTFKGKVPTDLLELMRLSLQTTHDLGALNERIKTVQYLIERGEQKLAQAFERGEHEHNH